MEAERVNQIAETVGLSTVQLHGDETPAQAAQIRRPVIKAVTRLDDAHLEMWPDRIILLVDAHDPVQSGVAGEHRGAGQTRRAQELANRQTLRRGLWQIPHLLRPILGNTNHRQTVADVTTFQPEEVRV